MSILKASGLMVLIMSVSLALPSARAGETLQRHFNEAAQSVHASTDPVEQREILDNEFQKVVDALNGVESMPLTSKIDRANIEKYRAIVEDKKSELNGTNGFDRVADAQLNAFATYTVQDMEQADTMITISLVTLLLIVILVFLIAR